MASMMERRNQILSGTPHIVATNSSFITDMAASLKSLKVAFTPIQSGGAGSIGWDGIIVKSFGKNLLNVNAQMEGHLSTGSGNASKRFFHPGALYKGTSGTNYFQAGNAAYSVNNDVLTINTRSGYGIGYAFRLIPGQKYTISCETNNATNVRVGVSSYAFDGTFTKVWEAYNLTEPRTFTVPSDSDILLLTFSAGSAAYSTDIQLSNIQLEMGSSRTTYEAYRQPQFYAVRFPAGGKNLYDADKCPLWEGKWVNGGDGSMSSNTSYAATYNFVPIGGLSGQQITINKRPGGTNMGVAFYSNENEASFIGGVKSNGGTAGTPWTITIPDGANFMRFTVPSGATDVQIELGDTSTSYEAHIPAASSGYVDLATGELTADGTTVALSPQQIKTLRGVNTFLQTGNGAVTTKYWSH